MAIDSVGGGGSRDSNYEVRRRMLEEERARELDRIEKRHKDEISQVQAAREKAIRDIQENQTSDIDAERAHSEARIAQAKLAAENRIKDYEANASKMSEEAKRQFQAKADLLNRNAQEMDHQREFLLKQQSDSMKKLKEEREAARYNQDFKLRQEASQAYETHKRSMNDLQARATEEQAALEAKIRGDVTSAKTEGERAVYNARREKEEAVASYSRELDQAKRLSGEQLERDRIVKDITKTVQQGKYDDELMDLRRRNQAAVQRTHREGQHKIEELKESYWRDMSQMQHDAKKKAQNQNLQANAAMTTIESNQKLEEKLAREGYEHKKHVMQERRDSYLAKAGEEASKLQERVAENYKYSAKQIEKSRTEALNARITQVQGELAKRRGDGERQLSALNEAHAKTVAAHAERASDAFYRIQKLNATVDNGETECVVRVRAPEHEKDGIRLTLQQDGLCLTGSRRYEDRMKTDDGRKVSTNAFQSYSETFPVSGKLEMKRMSRNYENGEIVFRIPKS